MNPQESSLVPLLLDAARALLEQGNWLRARESAQQAVRLAREAQETEAETEALFLLGRAAKEDGDEPAAREAWTRCRELQETRLLDPLAASRTLSELGMLHRAAGRLEEAREALRESLRLSSHAIPGLERATALEQMGIVERRLGQLEQAAQHLNEAVRIFEALGDPGRVAGAREKLGNTLQNLGRLDEAMSQYEMCLEVFTKAQDRAQLASIRNNIACTLHQQGRHREAIAEFQKARELFKSLGKRRSLAVALGNLGVLSLLVGQAEDAEEMLAGALQIYDELGERLLQASVLSNLSLLRLESGQYPESIGFADRAIALREEHGSGDGLIQALRNKCRALLFLDRFGEAESALDRAQLEAQQSEAIEDRIEVLRLEAELHLARGRLGEAHRAASRALELARDFPGDEAHALQVLGTIEARRGRRDEARDLLLQAESRYRRFTDPFALGLCALELGGLFLQVEAYEAAAQRLREARLAFHGFANRELEWSALCRLAEAEYAVSEEQARITLEEARALARELDWQNRIAEIDALEKRLQERTAVDPQLVLDQIRRLEREFALCETGDDAIRFCLEALRGRRGVAAAEWVGSRSAPGLYRSLGLQLDRARSAEVSDELERVAGRVRSTEESIALPSNEDGLGAIVVPVRSRPTTVLLVLVREGRMRSLRAWLEGVGILLGAALRGGDRSLSTSTGGSTNPDSEPEGALPGARGIVGASALMRRVFRTIEQVAPTTASVLIEGESGTGKELVARALHDASGRSGAFVAINCPSFPESLIESELFGYEKGAFTGAAQRRSGQIELAHKGTLFLDEVGDMAMTTQTKLLRFLEQREFLRVGGREPVAVDVRLVAATSRDLERELAAGRFRQDLYHRIKVVPIRLPALRERPEDVPILARSFLAELAPGAIISDDAIRAIQFHPWPGNVRELRNVIERLAATRSGQLVDLDSIPAEYRVPSADQVESAAAFAGGLGPSGETSELRPGETLQARLLTIEGTLLRTALERSDWNQTKAAVRLGLTESTLRDMMARYGIRRPESTRRAGRRPKVAGGSRQRGPRRKE